MAISTLHTTLGRLPAISLGWRKTILMESPEEVIAEERYEDSDWLPPNLTARQLRDLADLEEERSAGAITEADYRRRRREILDRL